MRISDWSSDVCSSDLARVHDGQRRLARPSGQARLDRYFVLSGSGCGCGFCFGPLRTKHGLLREAHSVRRSGGLKLDGMPLAAATHADDCYRTDEHTSEIQSIIRISDADFFMHKTKNII